MTDLRTAAQQALEALEELNGWPSLAPPLASQAGRQAAINLRAALEQFAHPPRRETEQEPQCNPHPNAPHGFLRNASHTEGRYVCACEYWQPCEAAHEIKE
jgi:hypothetical protein